MAKKKDSEKRIAAFKCVRPDGTDFHTGKLNYIAALESGKPVEVLDAGPANGNVCGHGIHVSPTAHKTIQFANRSHRPWRWLQGTVSEADVIESDSEKMRVRRFFPEKEIFLADIFGADFAARIEAAKAETQTWKTIPWLKPTKRVTEKEIAELLKQWREAIEPWLKGKRLPSCVRIVRTANEVKAVAADAADAAADAAAAAAAAAVAAAAAAAVAADAAAAVAADADAAAAAAAVAADADADADADAAVAAAFYFRHWVRWYVRPWYVLRRSFRWQLFMEGPNPSAPMIDLYRLGCLPIGFVKGKFVVYVPRGAA